MTQYNKESGQGLTEYAVILSLVAIASIAAMGFFGGAIKSKMASLSSAVAGDNQSTVNKAEQDAQKNSKSARSNASKVKGTTKIDNDDIFDRK